MSGITQSPVERRAAEAQFREMIRKFAPKHLRLIEAARRWLRRRLPTAYEVVYEYRAWFVISYSPSERGYEGVLAIRGSADGAKLYFTRGKELPDTDNLLKGTATARWIRLESASTLARPAVSRLIDEAIARNPTPFARADRGQGTVIIRSASTQSKTRGGGKRQRRRRV